MAAYTVKNIYLPDTDVKKDGQIKSVSYFDYCEYHSHIKHCAPDAITKLRAK
jgi:hypothetical protein